ncbi:hypothetical protein HDU97_004533 [Phlyctochytrium planicorne]|nr:hypothetical protein HDU97_004533 [Phlyctochytrium planicorne]
MVGQWSVLAVVATVVIRTVVAQEMPYTAWAVLGDTAYFSDARQQTKIYYVGPTRKNPYFIRGFPIAPSISLSKENNIFFVDDLGTVASSANGQTFVVTRYQVLFYYIDETGGFQQDLEPEINRRISVHDHAPTLNALEQMVVVCLRT